MSACYFVALCWPAGNPHLFSRYTIAAAVGGFVGIALEGWCCSTHPFLFFLWFFRCYTNPVLHMLCGQLVLELLLHLKLIELSHAP